MFHGLDFLPTFDILVRVSSLDIAPHTVQGHEKALGCFIPQSALFAKHQTRSCVLKFSFDSTLARLARLKVLQNDLGAV